MIRKTGTPVHANDGWLAPISGAGAPSGADPHDPTARLQATATPGPALDTDLIFSALPLSSRRELRQGADATGGLVLVATRVVTMEPRRHELEPVVLLRERAGRIEALFGDPAPSPDVRRQICVALGSRVRSSREAA